MQIQELSAGMRHASGFDDATGKFDLATTKVIANQLPLFHFPKKA